MDKKKLSKKFGLTRESQVIKSTKNGVDRCTVVSTYEFDMSKSDTPLNYIELDNIIYYAEIYGIKVESDCDKLKLKVTTRTNRSKNDELDWVKAERICITKSDKLIYKYLYALFNGFFIDIVSIYGVIDDTLDDLNMRVEKEENRLKELSK